jgi:hypothetical protein
MVELGWRLEVELGMKKGLGTLVVLVEPMLFPLEVELGLN